MDGSLRNLAEPLGDDQTLVSSIFAANIAPLYYRNFTKVRDPVRDPASAVADTRRCVQVMLTWNTGAGEQYLAFETSQSLFLNPNNWGDQALVGATVPVWP
jgi:hypothetical protein